jgi:hypothetical protein
MDLLDVLFLWDCLVCQTFNGYGNMQWWDVLFWGDFMLCFVVC